ncbi:VOC family protein [Glycomyces paridis]|uniref:VOC family protein n=1 Tax=Glycomyces paridis TaxID=2126555 RepID=UPI0013053284|nr:VOC family protein [Glycomyces paridis]
MATSIPLGAPIWADSNTPDLRGDLEFYTRLFNWTSFDSGEQFGHYTELCLGTTVSTARAVAGLGANPPGEPDRPAAWGVSFHVDDCVQAAAEAEKLGGTVVGHPMRIGDDLVYAAMRDPDGGAFGLFEPLNDHVGFTARDEPGAVVWFEYVYDGAPVEAMQFYSELLNWALKVPGADEVPHEAPYVGLWTHHAGVLPGGSVEFGGARMALGPELDLRPHWLACVGTDSVDLTAAKAVDLGGSVAVAPVDDPGGRMAVLASPSGAHFSVMSSRE